MNPNPDRRTHFIFLFAIFASAALSVVILVILVQALGWMLINVLGAAAVAFWIVSLIGDAIADRRANGMSRMNQKNKRDSL